MCALLHSPAVDLVGDVRFGSKADIAALNLDVRLPPIADIGGASGIWLPVYESARPSKFTYPTAGFSGESHQ
jgi:hypothetical protein